MSREPDRDPVFPAVQRQLRYPADEHAASCATALVPVRMHPRIRAEHRSAAGIGDHDAADRGIEVEGRHERDAHLEVALLQRGLIDGHARRSSATSVCRERSRAPLARSSSNTATSRSECPYRPESTPESRTTPRRAQVGQRTSVVADEQHRSTLLARHVPHSAEALPLECQIADGQHLVDDQNLRLQVRRDRKSQPHLHAAAVTLDRRVEEPLDLGERHDLVELLLDLARGSCRESRR